jgi:hypothetical protein
MYVIHAKISISSSSSSSSPSKVNVPEFLVDTGNREQALAIARRIIDPQQMIDTHISANEAPREAWRTALKDDLQDAIEALSGDSNDAEHETLFNIAQSLAAYTGQDFDALMYPNGKEDE